MVSNVCIHHNQKKEHWYKCPRVWRLNYSPLLSTITISSFPNDENFVDKKITKGERNMEGEWREDSRSCVVRKCHHSRFQSLMDIIRDQWLEWPIMRARERSFYYQLSCPLSLYFLLSFLSVVSLLSNSLPSVLSLSPSSPHYHTLVS